MTRIGVAALLALYLASVPASAQPALVEAKAHYERGLKLIEQHAWDAALAEFLRSREILPRASSTANAAKCLRELHRYDEALDLYEDALARSDIDAQTREYAKRSVEELRTYVGQLVVTGAEGATVVVDGRERDVARGPLRVTAGTHAVRATKAESAPFETRVEVAGQERVTVAVTWLPLGQKTIVQVVHDGGPGDNYHPLVFELVGGLPVAPSLGGEVAKTGAQGLGVGPLAELHVAFQTRFGLTLGVTAGYASIASKVSGDNAALTPVGKPAESVKANDSRSLRGALLGGAVGWHFGEVVPVTLRLGGGVFVGSLSDERTVSTMGLQIPAQSTAPGVSYGFVAPEARVGYRFAGHFEASAGAELLVLFGGAPTWDPAKVSQISVPGLGLASYGKETLASGAIVAVMPSVAIRYDL